MIPKVIYQTFYTKKIPDKIQSLITKMLDNNPNYEYHLYDDDEIDNFIKNEFEDDIYKAFKMINVGAAKADFWRYCILYKRGGIYLDLDSSIIGKLDDLIKSDDLAIVSREVHQNIFLQWCLIFSPNHPILEICINKCVENILSQKSNNILHLTGPVIFSYAVIEYCKKINISIWETIDYDVNRIIKENNLDLRLYSIDFKNFCEFKNEYEYEIINFNILNSKTSHWTKEKKIFKCE